MQLVKVDEIVKNLNKFEEFTAFPNLDCWKKVEENYNIYIFSIQLKNEEELLKIKDDLRDYLAIFFQSQTLEKDVERWNIYQVFFMQEPISLDVKLEIEQDKFATRKLIFDDVQMVLSDQEVEEKIYAEIFDFSINKKIPITDSLLDNLDIEEQGILSIIEKANGDIDKLLIQLGDE